MHPTDAELLLAEEAGADDPVRLHVGRCATCRDRIDALREDANAVFELLSVLDRPGPQPELDAMVASAVVWPGGAASGGRDGPAVESPVRWGARVSIRAAAGVVLTAVAVAAAVHPASPLRRLIQGPPVSPSGGAREESPGAETLPRRSGFAFAPEGRVRIDLPGAGGPDQIQVVPNQGPEVRVTTDPGVAFTLLPGREGVLTLSADRRLSTLTVEVPEGLEGLSFSRGDVLLWTSGGVGEALPRVGSGPLTVVPGG